MAVVVAATVAAGCSSSAANPAPTGTPAAAGTSTTLNATDSSSFFAHTEAAACGTDLQTMETAVSAYLAINGGTDVTEAQLVTAGLLRTESTLHDIGPAGAVIPAPGGGCAS
jgi:hypothetical protein